MYSLVREAFFPFAGTSIDGMSVFNPKMLDASIRDVVESLSNSDKTSVLLNAMERLPVHTEYVLYDSAGSARTL